MSPPYTFYDSWLMGIILIFVINIPVNLFWYVAILGVFLKRWGRDIGIIPERAAIFAGKLLLLSMAITFAGAMIDLLFLYERTGGYFVLEYDPLKWMFAAFLIFLSLFIMSHLVLKLRFRFNALISGTIALLNPFFWFLILLYEDGLMCWTLLITLLLTPLPLFYILRWHGSESIGND
ncbi:MAG: hypothetical protein R6W91_07070 [Thermoplasmata archaeon]